MQSGNSRFRCRPVLLSFNKLLTCYHFYTVLLKNFSSVRVKIVSFFFECFSSSSWKLLYKERLWLVPVVYIDERLTLKSLNLLMRNWFWAHRHIQISIMCTHKWVRPCLGNTDDPLCSLQSAEYCHHVCLSVTFYTSVCVTVCVCVFFIQCVLLQPSPPPQT